MPDPALRARLASYIPFAVVAVVGQVSVAWPPGPTDPALYLASSLLLLVILTLLFVRRGMPPRTFVVGSDPQKLKLRDDVGAAFAEGKRYFEQTPDITASQFFAHVVSLAHKFGWEFGGPIAGHLIGQFPHEKISGDKVTLYVHPDSHLPMRSLNEKGQKRHWILEIHFVDRKRQIGGFFEELLTVS